MERAEVGGAERRRGFKWRQRNWSCEWGRKMRELGEIEGKMGETGGYWGSGGIGRKLERI